MLWKALAFHITFPSPFQLPLIHAGFGNFYSFLYTQYPLLNKPSQFICVEKCITAAGTGSSLNKLPFFLIRIVLIPGREPMPFFDQLYYCWSHSKNRKKKIYLNSYTIKTDQGEQGSIIPKNDISIPLFYSKWNQNQSFWKVGSFRYSWTLNSFLTAEIRNTWRGRKQFLHMNAAFLFP